MRWAWALLGATSFLTRLPLPGAGRHAIPDAGESLACYPLVGLVIGALLAAAALVLGDAPSLVKAALLLSLWVLITGGLHIDGLADSADAWAGAGVGEPERTLRIMKDPHAGPAAVMIICLVLIVKFAALTAVIDTRALATLALAPMLARASVPVLLLTTPYVRQGGLGTKLAAKARCRSVLVAIALVPVAAVALAGVTGVWMLAVVAIVVTATRALMLARIGGTTGDTLGATVEIAEAATLVAAAIAA